MAFGYVATAVYVSFIAFVCWKAGPQFYVEIKVPLDLNTFGDALSGFCAPLAFLWLFVATMVQSQDRQGHFSKQALRRAFAAK